MYFKEWSTVKEKTILHKIHTLSKIKTGIIYIMPRNYFFYHKAIKNIKKRFQIACIFGQIVYICGMTKLNILSVYSFMRLFPDESSALSYI